MSEKRRYARLSRADKVAAAPSRKVFDEFPGEAEADAVRDAFLKGAGSAPAGVAAALADADGAMRARVVSRLQRERGNAYIQRVVDEARGRPGRLVGASQSAMVEAVASRKAAGTPLPPGTRATMEGFFGADLRRVRVHTGGAAVQLTRELNAQAFTVGHEIFFAEGKYSPSTREGQGILAHELTHVGQQTGFRGTVAQPLAAVQRESAEEEEPPAPAASPMQEEEPEAA